MQEVAGSQHRHVHVTRLLLLVLGACAGCSLIAGLGNFKDAPPPGTGGAGGGATSTSGSTSSSGGCHPATGAGGGGGQAAGAGGGDGGTTCTIDCVGGACVGGQCQPVRIVQDSCDDIKGLAITVDNMGAATAVFWLVGDASPSGGAVKRVSLDLGSLPTTVAAMQCTPTAIVTDNMGMYWVDEGACAGGAGGQVWSASVDGKAAQALYTGERGPVAIAVYQSNLYWLDGGDMTMRSAPKTGGVVTTLPPTPANPSAIAVSFLGIHWTEIGTPGSVWKSGVDGKGAAIEADNQGQPTAVALGVLKVYWTDTAKGAVMTLNNTTPTPIAMGAAPRGLALDVVRQYAYWAESGAGKIWGTPLGGSAPTVLAQGQSTPVALVIDAKSVFYVNSSGGRGTEIWRVAR
jgi:hypothetical protein